MSKNILKTEKLTIDFRPYVWGECDTDTSFKGALNSKYQCFYITLDTKSGIQEVGTYFPNSR